MAQEHLEPSKDNDTAQQVEQNTLAEVMPPLNNNPPIILNDADFDCFMEHLNTQQKAPARLIQAAELLDKEGF